MKQISTGKKSFFFYLLIALAAFLPYLLYGFRYFPILDDYIQYWGYPAHNNLSYVYLKIGTLSTRPLASLLDPAFWGHFWPAMGVALTLITVMHILSSLFFSETLKKYGCMPSPLFFLIYLLLPLGMEGRYWLSASTRIISGLFFSSVSLWFLAKFLEEKQSVTSFLFFAIFQLLSCGFYESVAVFSVSSAVLLSVISFYKKRKTILFLPPVCSVFNITFMFLYYRIFAGLGALGSRAESAGTASLLDKFFDMLWQVFQTFSQLYHAIIKGSIQGIMVLFSKGFYGIFLFVTILILSFLLCRSVKISRPFSKKKNFCFIAVGIILFFAPLLPNVLAEDVWITNRSIFVSILGIALILEPFWTLFHKKHFCQILIFLVTFVFITANINEYDVYKRANELDTKLLDEIVLQLEDEVIAGEKDLVVLLPEKVMVRQNAFYKDHVKCVFDSDLALTGALRARLKSLSLRYAIPVLPGQSADIENAQVIVIDSLKE